MARIKGKNTKPEWVVRRALHALGYRFRLHRGELPGRPDIVLPKHKMVILVHGCFWHRHPGCSKASMPKTRVDFWRDKFETNVARDQCNVEALKEAGWQVLIVWECETSQIKALSARLDAHLKPGGLGSSTA
jgi:DNA mismatch endonuclease (patch repair protein)